MATRTTTKTTQKTETKNTKMTPYEQEVVNAIKKINEYRLIAEANVVSILYKKPELIKENNLDVENFRNNTWRVFFAIVNDLYNVEKKFEIDDITVNFYLEKHPNLRKKYDEYGGWETISSATGYVKVNNFEGYLGDLQKCEALTKLVKLGFPVQERLADFWDMSMEDIYNEYTAYLNNVFINAQSEIKSYNGFDGLYELIDKANAGENIGLPLHNAPFLTKEIGGWNLNGNIFALGAASGCGKTTMTINYLFPSAVEYNEPIVFFINEQDESNFRKEALIWVCSNILKKPVPKYKFRDGNFDDETLQTLHEAAAWLEEKKDQKLITIIPLEKYTARIVCKLIKKYSALGCRAFCLDTAKESADSRDEATHKSMERDFVDLYDTVKPAVCNVGLWVTYQISKSSTKIRHLTNADIGQARSIVDVMSVNQLMRKVFEDEYTGEKRELHVYKFEGKRGNTKIPVKLDKDKRYVLTFLGKNRFGKTDEYAIVAECDLSTNLHHDIGYCIVPEDEFTGR